MIQIETGILNTVVGTCSRNKQLTGNVTYLWSLTHKLTKQNWRSIPYRIASVTPGYDPSYDLFYVDVDNTSPEVFIATGATNVNLHLLPGQYYVKVYEQVSTTNLNPALSYNAVYETTANVNYSGSPQNEIVAYTGGSNNEVFKIYNG